MGQMDLSLAGMPKFLRTHATNPSGGDLSRLGQALFQHVPSLSRWADLTPTVKKAALQRAFVLAAHSLNMDFAALNIAPHEQEFGRTTEDFTRNERGQWVMSVPGYSPMEVSSAAYNEAEITMDPKMLDRPVSEVLEGLGMGLKRVGQFYDLAYPYEPTDYGPPDDVFRRREALNDPQRAQRERGELRMEALMDGRMLGAHAWQVELHNQREEAGSGSHLLEYLVDLGLRLEGRDRGGLG